ncbi:MAG: TauD/TfdA family dioxygenase [Gammaproteobacteria bacterium]|nr:MAG: TauD/TfdA family dioxygenase [Gammaproteobacteria bacterium]
MEHYHLRALQKQELSFETSGSGYPIVLTPTALGFDPSHGGLRETLRNHAPRLRETIAGNGALLLRGFPIESPAEFEASLYALGYDLYQNNVGGVSPRGKITNATYSSTDAASPFVIGIHTEFPYHSVRPSMISFYCDTAPSIYGETPIFDCAAVLEDLSDELKHKLKTLRLRYSRFFSARKNTLFNFRKPWMDAFLTPDRAVVERHLEQEGIAYSWDRQGNLKTQHTVPAVITDPVSGRECLNIAIFNGDTFAYNIGHFAHRYNPFKRHLVQWFVRREGSKKDAFLRTTFGDGSEISRSESEAIQKAAWANAIAYRWLRGDMLILSNIRFGHARLNVAGARRIVTAMGDKYDIRALPAYAA